MMPQTSPLSDENGLNSSGAIRRRTINAYVAQSHAARQTTRDVTRKLTSWHAQIARLRGLAEHHGAAHPRIDLYEEIESLANEIRSQQRAFLAKVQTLPADVARNDRIVDAERALSRAALVLETIGAPLRER